MMKAAVIGAGAVGLAVADELSRRGIAVELFERSGQPGAEASGAAAGILSPQAEADGPGPFWDLLSEAHRLIPETVERLQRLSGLSLDYRADGMFGLAFTVDDEAALDRQAAWQQRCGVVFERVDPARVRREEPAVDGRVRSGIFWRDNAQLDPVMLVQAYRKAAELQGVRFHWSRPVTRLLLEGDRVRGVESAGVPTEADAVVDCAGSWGGLEGVLPFKIPLEPVRGQMLEFSVEKPVVRAIVHSPRAYLVQRAGGKLVAGTTLERVGFDRTVTEEGRRAIQAGVEEMCSGGSCWRFERAWAGLRPETPDHLPILGKTPLSGFWVAAGHYRNGILLAPLTGRLMADLITGKSGPERIAPFSLRRFEK